jgi:hypothetical protein
VPAVLSIGDTACIKSRPLKGAVRQTQGAGWHCSHLEGKTANGRQAFAAAAAAGSGPARCLEIELCGMGKSKIEMACSFAAGLPRKARGYTLFDSRHSCQAVVEAFWGAGLHSIGDLKQTGRLCLWDKDVHKRACREDQFRGNLPRCSRLQPLSRLQLRDTVKGILRQQSCCRGPRGLWRHSCARIWICPRKRLWDHMGFAGK